MMCITGCSSKPTTSNKEIEQETTEEETSKEFENKEWKIEDEDIIINIVKN